MSLHVEAFARKVKAMNQTQSKNLTLSADDARNLHSEIFDLLARIADLTDARKAATAPVTEVELDGGGFKTS